MIEEWKAIVEFPSYQVSSLGRVRNKNGKILTPRRHTAGYLRVSFYKDGKNIDKYIHRLVAEAFLPNKDNLPVINHRDEHKDNNNVTNLEWCTQEYNSNYGTGKIRMGKSHQKPVKQFDRQGNFIREWESQQEAEEALNLRAGTISNYINSPYHWE